MSTPEQRRRAVLAEIREASRIFRARNNTDRKFEVDDVQPRNLIAPWSVAYSSLRRELNSLSLFALQPGRVSPAHEAWSRTC